MDELYIVKAPDVIQVSLTGQDGKETMEAFPPTYTYAMFGEEEIIPGYKDLKIKLSFRANDLEPTVSIRYDQKVKPVNEEMKELMDIEGCLSSFLPETAWTPQEKDISTEAWTPPGELLHTYTVDKSRFEIWQSTLADVRAKKILSNMRIFIPFFIDGGTVAFLEDEDWALERWKVFFLYEIGSPDSTCPSYTIAGFGTSYRLWVFPSTEILAPMPIDDSHTDFKDDQDSLPEQISPLLLPSRERIAQFMILPPYQGKSHGSWLYTVMTTAFRKDKWVYEITVEEPNDEFDALRDYCDLAYLHECHPEFKNLALPEKIAPEQLRDTRKIPLDLLTNLDALHGIRLAAKIAPRQFQRITEMHLLSTIPAISRNTARISNKGRSANVSDRQYYFWRLLTKERIFVKNKDQLLQIDEDERVEKVEDTVESVQMEYEERWRTFVKRMDKGLRKCVSNVVETMGGEADAKAVQAGGRKKRKVVTDDDEEIFESGGVPLKKMRNGTDEMMEGVAPTF
ncbi:histone acetyltransferase type B [Venturia nashicola]|uniref:Histone acetyltransferase type B catalytic subunit n=1 Tax=Venturia nashicola TaxID=86259 RepID=A0A4Z1NHK1_9PEZI|nr:histone acetyltransferase type B [Venturia nashicola]